MRIGLAGALIAGLLLSACATAGEHREMQRPQLPSNQAIGWSRDDRLYQSVAIDYVTGMSRRSYLFGEANQSAFRPLLLRALKRSDLLAPTPVAARYALQIEFSELEGSNVGADFQSHSVATYRIVRRATDEVIYERTVPASFVAEFPMLDERDAEKAWLRSAGPLGTVNRIGAGGIIGESVFVEYLANNDTARRRLGIGAVTEATQPEWNTAWRRYYQANVWASLWGPVTTGLEFISPTNFIALPNFWGAAPTEPVLGARLGALSMGGVGARSGRERAKQADFQMMAQSITKFMIDVGDAERVRFTTIVPCLDSREVLDLRAQLSANGVPWVTDNCTAYSRDTQRGVTFATGR